MWYRHLLTDIYKTVLDKNGALQGVRDTLEKLSQEEIEVIAVTDLEKTVCEDYLAEFSLDSFFDHVYSSEDFMTNKSEADIYLKVAEELKLEKAKCLVVGDSESKDIIPPSETGFTTVRVIYNKKGESTEKTDTAADYTVSSFNEILDILN